MAHAFPQRLRRRETLCGIVVAAVAAAAGLEASGYAFGSVDRIGPGFLPVVYAAILGGLGLAIAAVGWHDQSTVERPALRPILVVIGALLSWAWLAPRVGFFAATALLVFIGAFGQGRLRPLETALLAIATAAATSVVFVGIFALPLPVWPWP
ncbi:hypothetical protein Ga0609869_002082 [Rhodovulum iodosum]|uniref:DUF1468 domain-containing protein n=1 Tax=Rhodovulum iodosum TaxID=68291 RepID=A0ABV3XTS0_9RHOB|nr:tripartite tricarboxylate transporter TctB family protein [Rhodovulum robiginosum]RSK32167.1 tripartite tricarboxylate transporter TctB family protein [Rhodovulum robiginosum]